MRFLIALLAVITVLSGCKSGSGEHSQMDTHADLKDIKTTTRPDDGAIRMPGGIGITGGQTGTGTTSG